MQCLAKGGPKRVADASFADSIPHRSPPFFVAAQNTRHRLLLKSLDLIYYYRSGLPNVETSLRLQTQTFSIQYWIKLFWNASS
ncbi:hypothetical protein SUGI_0876680 [Cryptomeria japonica]|nr:hypothetical protein SUGI_0876680 [Cryptomeria japonica]